MTEPEKSGADRRAWPRVATEVPLRFRVVSTVRAAEPSQGDSYSQVDGGQGETKDISGGGVLLMWWKCQDCPYCEDWVFNLVCKQDDCVFNVDQAFPAGLIMDIEIFIPDQTDPVAARAEVVRHRENGVMAGELTPRHHIGVKFLTIADSDRDRLLDYLQKAQKTA